MILNDNYNFPQFESKLINEKFANGWTCLMIAAMNGYVDVCKLLLDQPGIIANAINDDKENAFIIACKRGKDKVVNLLLDYVQKLRIDQNSCDAWGYTGYLTAKKNNHVKVQKRIEARAVECNIDLEKEVVEIPGPGLIDVPGGYKKMIVNPNIFIYVDDDENVNFEISKYI